MDYKNILLAIDGSDASDAALQETLKFTKHHKATIRLVYVVDESLIYYGGPGFDYLTIIAAYKEEGHTILTKAAKIITSQSSHKVEQELIELKPLQGRIAEAIVSAATDWPADLIVMGTHGRRGFSRLFLGSVAENVLRISRLPVLLVHGALTEEN